MGKGIIFNEDSDHFYNLLKQNHDMAEDITKERLSAYIDTFKDTDVTDFFCNVGGLLSSFPSNVKTSYPDKFLLTEEAGKPCDWHGTVLEVAYNIWRKNGFDMFQIWFDRCRELGITPWVSVRMNDSHCLIDDPLPNFLVPSEYYENYDRYSRVRHRRQTSYFDRTRDFEVKEVRDCMYEYIKETLERYDVEGIELDYQRDLRCFAPGHEQVGRQIMTEFVGDVKALVTEMEKRYGHKIRIAVRNHALPEGAWENGMDILEWAKRGYLDMYICSPRWRTMDNDMPVYLWKQMLSPYGIEVAGGLEVNIQSHRYGPWEGFSMTTQTSLGSAAYILSEGADKLYLFNYFGFAQHFDPEYDDLDHPLSPSGQKYFLSTAGDLDKILKEKRKCVSSYRDFNAIWRSEKNGDLPVELTDTAEPVFVHVKTGNILPGSEVLLHLGISGISEQDMEVYVNSVPVKLIGKGACEEPVLTESCVYTFEVLEEAIQPLVQVAEIVLNTEGKKAIVDYTDFTIE